MTRNSLVSPDLYYRGGLFQEIWLRDEYLHVSFFKRKLSAMKKLLEELEPVMTIDLGSV